MPRPDIDIRRLAAATRAPSPRARLCRTRSPAALPTATKLPEGAAAVLSRQRRPPPLPKGNPRFGIPSKACRQPIVRGSPSPRPTPVRLAARGPSAPTPPQLPGPEEGTLVLRTSPGGPSSLSAPVLRPSLLSRAPCRSAALPSLDLSRSSRSLLTSLYLYCRDPDEYVTSLAGYTVMFQCLLSETGHI